MGTTDNTFNNSDEGEQNIGQGNEAIGKQENINQDVRGSGHIFSGSGNVHVEQHHHHYPRTPQGIPLQRPRQPDHLVGREELLKEVLAALQPGKAVTLCGPGGIGKTALASRAAWELSPDGRPPACFPDGLIFYSFYGRKDVNLAFDHLMRSYVDDSQDNSPEAVRQLLASKQALIILDGAEEADDLTAVLRCCEGCGVLITSRKRSDSPGGLIEVKRLEELPAAEAFRLYSRGTACCAPTPADETTVQAVCEQLGGWPLALRIAGHYLRSTGESAVEYLRWLEKEPLKELGDGEHQDENAALLLRRSVAQVSHDARLALGVAGCLAFAPIARKPVAYVLEGDERRARKALGELVNYGLLERREERWQVSHALVHTYARTELNLSKEHLEQVAAYYMDFCETQSNAGLEGYARLDGERAHCLQLMGRCFECELFGELSHLLVAMDNYLDLQGHWTERQDAFKMMLAADEQAGKYKHKAWCLNQLGLTCRKHGDYAKAFECFDQSLTIYREIGDEQAEGTILNNIGWTLDIQGNYEHALQYYKKSLRIRQKIGNQSDIGQTLTNIAMCYTGQGNHEIALKYLKRDLAICRNVKDEIGEAATLNGIGSIYYHKNRFTKALKYWRQALALAQKHGDKAGEAVICFNIAGAFHAQSDLDSTEEYIALAVQIGDQIGHPDAEKWREGLAQVRAARQGTQEA